MSNADWRRPSPRLRRARHAEAAAGTVLAAVLAGVLAGLSSLAAAAIAVGCVVLAGGVADLGMQRGGGGAPRGSRRRRRQAAARRSVGLPRARGRPARPARAARAAAVGRAVR